MHTLCFTGILSSFARAFARSLAEHVNDSDPIKLRSKAAGKTRRTANAPETGTRLPCARED
jgi:hypothetical protein